MALIPQEITLNISKRTEYCYIDIPQGDNIDRVFYIKLVNGSDDYIVPSTAQVTFSMSRVNAEPIFNNCPVTTDGKIKFTVTSAISALNGRHPCTFTIVDSATGGTTSTFASTMLIEKGVNIEQFIVKTGEFTALTEALLKVGDVVTQVEACKTATTNANNAATSANAAATLANEKATLADSKATLADEKATLANDAATDATNAANTANQTNTTIQSAEALRVIAETNRATAETTRQEFYDAYKILETYDDTKNYIVGNHITKFGASYQCISPTTANSGHSPIANADNTWWKCIAAKGADGTGGNMMTTVYDTENKATDIFKYIGDKSQLQTQSNADLVSAVNEVDELTKLNGKGNSLYDTMPTPDEFPLGITTNLSHTIALGLYNILGYTWYTLITVRSLDNEVNAFLQYFYTSDKLFYRYGNVTTGWSLAWNIINVDNTIQALPNNVILSTDIQKNGDFDDYFDTVMAYSLIQIALTISLDRGDIATLNSTGTEIIDNLNTVTNKNISYYLGLDVNLSDSDKIGLSASIQTQNNIEILLEKIKKANQKTTILGVGSMRDISSAYNRNPSLFIDKVDKIYVFAGDYEGTYLETNVWLNEYAYLNIMNSGLPIYWIPCFQNGLWTTGNDTSYFNAQYNELFDSTTSNLFKWFLYYYSKDTSDFQTYLSQNHDTTTLMADTRNIWCASIIPMLFNNNYQTYVQQYNSENGTNITEPFSFIEDTVLFTSGGGVQHGIGHTIHRFHTNDRTSYVNFSKWLIKKIINNME